jgi:HD-like signal output (HDOD) protein
MLVEVIRRCAAGEGAFVELEDRIIGANHQAFGEALCAKWKFPKHLRAVVGNHHAVDRVSLEYRKMVTLVRVADVLACQLEIGFNLSAMNETITPEDLQTIGLSEAKLEEIRADLPEAAETAEATLSST